MVQMNSEASRIDSASREHGTIPIPSLFQCINTLDILRDLPFDVVKKNFLKPHANLLASWKVWRTVFSIFYAIKPSSFTIYCSKLRVFLKWYAQYIAPSIGLKVDITSFNQILFLMKEDVITIETLVQFMYARVYNGTSMRTVKGDISAINFFWQQLEKPNLFTMSSTLSLVIRSLCRKFDTDNGSDALPFDQIKDLINCAPERFRFSMIIAFFFMLRVSELANLTFEDCKLISVKHGEKVHRSLVLILHGTKTATKSQPTQVVEIEEIDSSFCLIKDFLVLRKAAPKTQKFIFPNFLGRKKSEKVFRLLPLIRSSKNVYRLSIPNILNLRIH